MKRGAIDRRYEQFCVDAQELLERSGLAREDQTPRITGKAFYEAAVALATMHFPEDTEVNGKGPRGLLRGMYDAVKPSHVGGKDPDPISGARSIALVMKQIISHRPPLDIDREREASGEASTDPGAKRAKPRTCVFVVHGHDSESKESVARFVERLGLRAVILHEQVNEGRTVIEKFEGHSEVDFAVVILTPDDVGYPRGQPQQARSRARQNVLFEWGYFVGRLGRKRVCALYHGDVEIPSDYHGVVYLTMDKAGAWKISLARELKQAGLRVNLDDTL